MDHFTETLDHLMWILLFIIARCGKVALIGLDRTGKQS
jgi:hypothetical protein